MNTPTFRTLACTALFLGLVLVLESGRALPLLEREFSPELARLLRVTAEESGLAALSQAQRAAVARWNTSCILGALADRAAPAESPPPAAPSLKQASKKPSQLKPEQPGAARQADQAGQANPGIAAAPPHGEAGPPDGTDTTGQPGSAAAPSGPETGQPDAAGAEPAGTAPASLPLVPAAKPKVLIVGDSLIMEGFGPVLQRNLRARGDLDVVREGKYSTGLTRTDQFDWPTQLAELVEKHRPDLILICLGANDPQDIIDENRKRHIAGTASWQALYKERADRFVQAGLAQGATLLWVGLPIMGLPTYDDRIRLLSELQEQACREQEAQCTYVPNRRTLAGPAGEYLTYLTDAKGRHIRLRYKDKVHVTEDGGRLMVTRLLPFIDEALKARTASTARTPVQPATPPAP